MDDKLNELKEKQAEIGDKISLLQQTNKRKDEEAAEIRQLIAECRENLNRIKGITPGTEDVLAPCSEFGDPGETSRTSDSSKRESVREEESSPRKGSGRSYDSSKKRDSARKDVTESGFTQSEVGRERGSLRNEDRGEIKRPCSSRTMAVDRKRCAELLAKRDCKTVETKQKKKKRDGDRVSCKVDLNKMKVRIRGPSEDLKKLDATQLINLLEKFQCQELIINTGEEIIQFLIGTLFLIKDWFVFCGILPTFISDPGEIRLVYFLHPGNIVMIAGIIMIAFLINANLCNEKNSCKKKFLLSLLYLGSFSFHFGMVLWVTFIRGYALKFGLNPDTYHQVDNLILPKYFSLCVLLSALTLYSFLATHCVTPCTSWPLEVLAQMIVVVVTFVMELITICYIIPALIKLRGATDDYMFDDEDLECLVPESYEKNLMKLGKLNWTVCLVNFLTLLFLGVNIYYITSKLNIGDTSIPPLVSHVSTFP